VHNFLDYLDDGNLVRTRIFELDVEGRLFFRSSGASSCWSGYRDGAAETPKRFSKSFTSS